MQQTTTGWTDGHIACLQLSLLRWRGYYSRIISRIDERVNNLDEFTVSNSFAENLVYIQAQAMLSLGKKVEAGQIYQRLLEKKGRFYFGDLQKLRSSFLAGRLHCGR